MRAKKQHGLDGHSLVAAEGRVMKDMVVSRLAVKVIGRLYSSLSWAYSPAVWILTGGLYYRWTFAAERFVRQGPVLDVGCGRGRLLARLAGQGLEVIGVDNSPQMVQAAQRCLDRK